MLCYDLVDGANCSLFLCNLISLLFRISDQPDFDGSTLFSNLCYFIFSYGDMIWHVCVFLWEVGYNIHVFICEYGVELVYKCMLFAVIRSEILHIHKRYNKLSPCMLHLVHTLNIKYITCFSALMC